jgi:phosphatidate cytidylyltransferase
VVPADSKNRNLFLRIASAVVLLPIVLWILYLGGYFSGALLGWAASVCAFEYYAIVFKRLPGVAWFAVGLSFAFPFLPVAFPISAGLLAFAMIGTVLAAAWIFFLIRSPLADAPTRAAHVVTGFIYGPSGLAALSAVRMNPDGLAWVYIALIITWANDTCAYFGGRLFGKHKLYPEVSPNKTWEGFAFGIVGSVLGLFIARAVAFHFLNISDCLAVGLLGGILGPIGDLTESMLKRAYDVKDSGKILPGHGGLLDRIDALIFNAPAVLLYVSLVHTHLF